MENNDAPQQEPTTAKAKKGRRVGIIVGAIALTAVVTAGATAVLANVIERMSEAKDPYTKVVELDDTISDPAVWGQNFPLQYEAYLRSSEMTPTVFGGSHKEERTPTATDPRTVISTSRLEEDPRLKDMWAGYPFSVDYRHARGHAYMLEDQRYTLRVLEFNQPGTCLNCHASTVTIMNELGDGDRQAGFEKMNQMPYVDVTQLAEHPVACIDCHDPKTMELRITRPAFEKGIAAYKKTQGVEDYDVNRDATRQEMRSFVCGQCHVEYYFEKESKELIFPWTKGLDIDEIWEYYQEDGHKDFEHKTTGAKVVKAQHPEFDIFWSNSIHAANGVSCADCHMPYEAEGARKVTNHHIQSPLLNVNASCMTCHSATEKEMTDRVVGIQDQFIGTRDRAFDSLVSLIRALEKAQTDGIDEATLNAAREFQNKASFYLDYVYSENSYGFHAPAYIQRILADSLDASRKGQLVLQGSDPASLEASDITTANRERAEQR
ncbi:MAG: ammonia-forming cytochrome c nitrite reductase subunit c552 [Tessaracoccus sp.]|uniref:ammonia-forming cytochrome c nitrite reductase subunit c552 n=1 Tax=Tessaracoccus sp. TaxID=1971211 RepID=UPI001ED1732F|nr:ammonia-forming cytochrome c nitrite reductase subunit c552 [Tessaracoccus sp.]MBK7820673.1 ammonia-forming cytochrome c nitrite reductase subunit c552 [Tessaracoccus sp.]